jgi:hypothetical protein
MSGDVWDRSPKVDQLSDHLTWREAISLPSIWAGFVKSVARQITLARYL